MQTKAINQVIIQSPSVILPYTDIDLLKEYYARIKNTRRPKTANLYLYLLGHFADYLRKRNTGIHIATYTDIQDYIANKKGWHGKSTSHFLSILKSFYSWSLNKIPIGYSNEELRARLIRENEIREILAYPMPRIHTEKKNKALTITEVKFLLDYTKKKNINDYCLIWALLYFGMRKGELCGLSPIKDINWKEKYLIVTAEKSKTHAGRTLYFDDYTKSILEHILKTYGTRKMLIAEREDTYLNKRLELYSKVIHRHIFPHMMRHTYNTNMLKSLKDKFDLDAEIVVKALMGHQSVGSTSIYTSLEDEPKIAMLKYHYLYMLEGNT